jgi:16S rRNA (cytosine1402-N4)-methyltransferase
MTDEEKALQHITVLQEVSIELLNVRAGGHYVDGTLGLGGHSAAILKRLNGHGGLLGLDVDRRNIEEAERRLQPFGSLTRTRQVNFRGLHEALRSVGWQSVDGILLDLGIASSQLDDSERGLSFMHEGPLDMRLDPGMPKTALDHLRFISEEKFAALLKEYGEERFARKLSKWILAAVSRDEIRTTTDLAKLCERAVGRRGPTHPATRVFLALRCLVNDEQGALDDFLKVAPDCLNVGGRLAIISFHSIEDRQVKNAFRSLAHSDGPKKFQLLTKKPIVPDDQEMASNPRARSAKLRGLERVA